MRYYFFGDIHGNEYALEQCLKHLDETRAERAYCLGDIVGWLPFGDRTLQTMRSLELPTVAGNHDLLVAGLLTDHPDQLDRMQATAYNAGLLSTVPGAVDYLMQLPMIITEETFQVVHHSPFHFPQAVAAITIDSFGYLSDAALGQCLEKWQKQPSNIIFSGHDHVPAIYELPLMDKIPNIEDIVVHKPKPRNHLTLAMTAGHKYWVKAGCVGGPYRDSVPICNSVLFDSDRQIITLFRLPYSTERLYQELRSHRFCTNLPTIRRFVELLKPDREDI